MEASTESVEAIATSYNPSTIAIRYPQRPQIFPVLLSILTVNGLLIFTLFYSFLILGLSFTLFGL
ncbi:MAG: hypothetical protein O4751_06125 [Trichodesmium sp. St2_bin6]|nr:hypothetical protein [Trichodesmium sp. St2_bin6]